MNRTAQVRYRKVSLSIVHWTMVKLTVLSHSACFEIFQMHVAL